MGVRRLGTSKRVEKQRTKIYWVRGWDKVGERWRQGANIGAKVLLGSPRHSIFFIIKKCIKFVKRGLEISAVAK